MGSKTLLVLSQVYVPDPTSVGQHMADASVEMVKRGWRVVVFTSDRGYENPSDKYTRYETIDGVEVRRLPLTSFGKHSMALRLLAACSFVLQCIFLGLFVRRVAAVFATTSPPFSSFGALVISLLRRVPIKFWVMDLNPDQLIAMEKISSSSVPARLFNGLNRLILHRADDIVALDRFMADRLNRKVNVSSKMHVMPPWPHQDHRDVVARANNPFRKNHGLEEKFVFMYSGNHGFTTPVTTILQAALRLQKEKELVFMFIGGGHGKKEVEQVIAEHHPPNIISLPYQPLSQTKYSLSAADVHLVTMWDQVVGIIHPCKIYGAMSVQRPILMVGPEPSHVTDILDEYRIGWRVPRGDTEAAAAMIRKIMATDKRELVEMGHRAAKAVAAHYTKQHLCGRFCDVLESGLCGPLATEASQ